MLALQKIAKQLENIASIDDAKEIRDKAEAIRVYSRQQKNCKAIEREAVIIRLRAERQLGKLLARVHAGNPNCKPGGQLPEGISRNQSSAWQLVAKVPKKQFEKYLESCRPTTKGLVRLGWENKRKRTRGPDAGGNIFTGDMWQLHSHLEDNSVDLFFTDPPYSDLECYSRLGELAAKKLRAGGLCLAYSGTHHLPEVMRRMSEHLDYYWVFSIIHKNHNSVLGKRLGCKWRPVVVFSLGKPDHGFCFDSIASSGKEKDLHEWQQPQADAEYFIEKLTQPGDLVVDPYVGSGTTLAAAKNLGRNYLGCEIDRGTARGARRRVAA